MEGTTGQLAAELNELFERIGLVLDKIDSTLPPEECAKCVEGLPAPSLLVFSRLLLMMGKHLQKEPVHIPTDKSNTAFIHPPESSAPADNHREDLCPPDDSGKEPSPNNDNDTLSNEASQSDRAGTGDQRQSHHNSGNSGNSDQRIDLYRPLSISTNLHDALVKHHGNPQSFLKSTHRIRPRVAGGLTGAFFRLHQKCEDIQDEKIRDLYLQMHFLYRRLEFRNLFLLAKELGYHTGERWCRDACPQLAAQIKKTHPSLDADELLQEYVRLGRAYNRWAEELGGPGYLLILPLTITEYQYTGREYSRYFSSAIESLRENGIDDSVKSNGLDVLGKKIADELWASSQETGDSLRRPLTKSALRKKRKREAKANEMNQTENKRRKMPRRKFRNTRSLGADTPSIDRPPDEQGYHHRHEASMDRSVIVSLATEDPRSPALLGLDVSLDTMMSLMPGGDADFPDTIHMMAPLMPGGDADFPDTIDMMAPLMPGGDADFPDIIHMMAPLMPGGDADFPDIIDMMAPLMPGGDADFPDMSNMVRPQDLGAIRQLATDIYAKNLHLDGALSHIPAEIVRHSGSDSSVAPLVQI